MKQNLRNKTLLITGVVLVGMWLFYYLQDNTLPKENKTQTTQFTKNTKFPASGAFAALSRWSLQRAYPNKTIPVETYKKEFTRYNKTGANYRTHQQSEWTTLGPHNVAGRTLALCLNPQNTQTIYLGSAGGGLWRSHSGGEGKVAWHQIATGFPVKAAGAIAIPADDSSTVYVGTGEVYRYKLTDGGRTDRLSRGTYGIGIIKSSDAGKTWSKVLDWESKDITGVQKIRINPKKSQTVFAATSEGVYLSYDAGSHWKNVLNVPMVTDILINAADTTHLLASCGNFQSDQYGMYRSTDGGQNWSKITSGFPANYTGKVLMSASKAYPDIVYASVGGVSTADVPRTTYLMRSKDKGLTWELRSDKDYSVYQYWFAHFVLAHDADSSKVLTAGVDIWSSDDAGKSLFKRSDWAAWSFSTEIGGDEGKNGTYAHADHHDAVSDPNNPDIVYIATDGGVFRSTDFGKSYKALNGSLQTAQFYSISAGPKDSLAVGGGLQDNTSVFYKGGKAWGKAIGGDGTITRYGGSDKEVYASAQYLALFRSDDGGENFNRLINWQQGNPAYSGTHFVAPYAISPANFNVIYAGGGTIYRSANKGTTWVLPKGITPVHAQSMFINTIGLSHFSANTLAVATAPESPLITTKPKVMLSTNGGDSFSDVTSGLPDRLIIDIEFDPNDANTFYVVFSGFGSGHVYRTTDLGSTWENISGNLPDVPHSTIFAPNGTPGLLFAGNDLGVYVSQDGGSNWETFSKSLPYPANVVDIAYNYSTQMMTIGTHGNGAYQASLAEFSTQIVSGVTLAKNANFGLYNYPNPVTDETKIQYKLASSAQVKLMLYDMSGKTVATLVNQRQNQGEQTVIWKKKGALAGMYKLVLHINGQRITRSLQVR